MGIKCLYYIYNEKRKRGKGEREMNLSKQELLDILGALSLDVNRLRKNRDAIKKINMKRNRLEQGKRTEKDMSTIITRLCTLSTKLYKEYEK